MRRNLSDPATRWPTLICLAGAIVAVLGVVFATLPVEDGESQAATLRDVAPFIITASGTIVAFAAVTLARRTHK